MAFRRQGGPVCRGAGGDRRSQRHLWCQRRQCRRARSLCQGRGVSCGARYPIGPDRTDECDQGRSAVDRSAGGAGRGAAEPDGRRCRRSRTRPGRATRPGPGDGAASLRPRLFSAGRTAKGARPIARDRYPRPAPGLCRPDHGPGRAADGRRAAGQRRLQPGNGAGSRKPRSVGRNSALSRRYRRSGRCNQCRGPGGQAGSAQYSRLAVSGRAAALPVRSGRRHSLVRAGVADRPERCAAADRICRDARRHGADDRHAGRRPQDHFPGRAQSASIFHAGGAGRTCRPIWSG